MTDLPVHSPWGDFLRASTTLTDGTAMVHDWYVRDGAPELVLQTPDHAAAQSLVAHLAPVLDDLPGWHRRAVEAVVVALSEEPPAAAEVEEAEGDLVVQTVEVLPSGGVVLHLDDSCGGHLPAGYWPAVRFGADGSVQGVTVEA